MKKIALSVCLAFGFLASLTAGASGVSGGLSIETPNYDRVYWTPAIELQYPAGKGVEFAMGVGIGINVDAAANPRFILPVWLGLNLLFGENRDFNWYVGLGLKPQVTFATEPAQFLMGPYAKLGMRAAIHPSASWFLELEQTLLIGPPKWINTGTKVFTGINFTITEAAK